MDIDGSTDKGGDLKIQIIIATQSGTAENLVEDVLLEKLHDAGCTTVVACLVDETFTDPSTALQLRSEDTGTTDSSKPWYPWPFPMSLDDDNATSTTPDVALFVVSTYGDGDPPNHAEGFAGWLAEASQPDSTNENAPVRYAVFGLGDRTYAHFAAFGSFVDDRMSFLGYKRLLPMRTGDKSGDQAGQFEQWANEIEAILSGDLRARGGPSATRRRPSAVTRRPAPFPSGTGADWTRSAVQRDAVAARVSSVQELTDRKSEQTVVHVTLSLQSSLMPCDFQPGDYVGIYPLNDPANVQRALEWLHIDGNMKTKVLEPSSTGSKWSTREITAFDFLSEHVDITGRATPSVLRALIPFIGTLELRALARDLTHVGTTTDATSSEMELESNGVSAFDRWVAGRWLTALDLAILFDSRLSLLGFARACGTLQPRLYSVVSVETGKDGAEKGNNLGAEPLTRISMCVAIAEGGLCSNYIARQDRELTVFLKPSKFRFLPNGKPSILVAAGAGVGTSVGFIGSQLQQISKTPLTTASSVLSQIQLYFGCRTQSELLYGDQLRSFTDQGLQLHVAYSRIPGQPKIHVQDLIRREAAAVYQAFFVDQGTLYICGRLELADGVRAALVDVARISGGLDYETAKGIIKEADHCGRIKMDCWSVERKVPGITIGHLAGVQRAAPSPHVVLRLERHHIPHARRHLQEQSDNLASIPSWPSYLRLLASGELEYRVQRATDMWSACVACGRNCETDRLSDDPDDWGECRVGQQAIVASFFPHFGEESCLVGTNGSGTIFFGACNLKCMYCQNWELSAMDEGEKFDDERLARAMLDLQKRGCHNINFVSPTHNLLAILRAVLIAARKGLHLPLVWNTGGYDSVVALRLLDGIVDIYMPDAKYASRKVARRLSSVDNYPEINQAAIKEMHRQVGELQIDPESGLARRGVLIRHLILPCELAGTCDVMGFLAKEVSADSYANVMDQYRPEHKAVRDTKYGLRRKPTRAELKSAHVEAKSAGLRRFDGEERSLEW